MCFGSTKVATRALAFRLSCKTSQKVAGLRQEPRIVVAGAVAAVVNATAGVGVEIEVAFALDDGSAVADCDNIAVVAAVPAWVPRLLFRCLMSYVPS